MKNDFFVGYLPASAATKRFVGSGVAVIVVIVMAVGAWLGTSQRGAGKGSWDPSSRITTTGLLLVDPYPVLHLANGRSVLLVQPGKKSADEVVAAFDGQHVAIHGAPIDRGGWAMLEVYETEDVQIVSPDEVIPTPVPRIGKVVTMHGEIADSKCYLGVMKPGAGKVHRACAAMCLTGGIPPMLVVTNEAGLKYGYMLVNADGASASLALVPDVAVPVLVSGIIEVRGELTYLRLSNAGVQRLSQAEILQVPPADGPIINLTSRPHFQPISSHIEPQ
ncbi:MAG: hypothetical protein P8L31_10755 [Pseudomonadales bacterium]|jgi:hypothetical protein|nr:hypothetical protein [Pseudomonadales bacterium]